jgi:hypothetical protein
MPSCSACVRLKRPCKYDGGGTSAIPEDYVALQQRLSYLERELFERGTLKDLSSSPQPAISSYSPRQHSWTEPRSSSSTFPASFFLDVDLFLHQRIKLSKPCLTVSEHILKVIGDELEIQATLGAYFFSTASWMGMISKKRLYDQTPAPSISMDADVALLVLSMKLVNERIPDEVKEPRTFLYFTVKDFYRMVESSSLATIRLLQSNILIALYETGHSIYPEAYLTVGQCGRVGQAVGLHDTARIPQLALEPRNWDEMEERRRVWWGVFILDR